MPGAADEQRHRAALAAAHMDLPFEDQHHVLGRRAFFKQNVAGIGDEFLPVAGQPKAIFKRQAMQGTDVIEGGGDLLRRRGRGGRKYCGG